MADEDVRQADQQQRLLGGEQAPGASRRAGPAPEHGTVPAGEVREAPAREREGSVSGFYWERHPGGPFATLVAVAAACCSAEAYDGLRPTDR
jgi:hypothetical protein